MIYERVAARSQWLSIIARSAIKEMTSVSNGALYRATLSMLLRDYSRNESVGELLEEIYSSWRAFLTVRPIQIKEEISALLSMVAKAGPRTVLEIGTANGGTLFLLSRVSAPSATLVSIDKPNGGFGGGYPKSLIPVFRSFAVNGQKVVLVRGDSHDGATISSTREALDGRQVDFLFIDGDHSYEGVQSDFRIYSPLVRKGGIIALHDIVPGLISHVGEVPRFWAEIRRSYESHEIVKDWGQGGAGIGLLKL